MAWNRDDLIFEGLTSWGFKRDKTFFGGASAVFRPHPEPLSHAVGEGLGVRARNSRRPTHEGFVSLETPTCETRKTG